MKNAKVASKKLRKAAKPRRVAGVQVRSGVKAGRRSPGSPELGDREFGSELRQFG